jgi:DNA repair exonuclease SbcCD ATPase subunit
MAGKQTGGRTLVAYDPSPRELQANIDSLRSLLAEKSEAFGKLLEINAIKEKLEAILELAKERDRWYSERDKDRQVQVDKALTAAKEQTASSFAASKEAILKAEEAQRSYNQTHNDLNRKMEEQSKMTMPRLETQQRFEGVEEKIAATNKVINDLRESREKSEGRGAGVNATWAAIASVAGILIAVIAVIVAFVAHGR